MYFFNNHILCILKLFYELKAIHVKGHTLSTLFSSCLTLVKKIEHELKKIEKLAVRYKNLHTYLQN